MWRDLNNSPRYYQEYHTVLFAGDEENISAVFNELVHALRVVLIIAVYIVRVDQDNLFVGV